MEKRWLVLSGGGSFGAFQAGALKHLLGRRNIQYEGISGSSVGALNGALIASYPAEDANKAAERLEGLWMQMQTKKVYKSWFMGFVGMSFFFLPRKIFRWDNPLYRSSMYDSRPLKKLVYNEISATDIAASGFQYRCGAVNQRTKQRRIWTESDSSLLDGILASSSFPLFFCPVEVEGETYVDDSVREITPIRQAIDAGATHVDVITTSPPGPPPTRAEASAISQIQGLIDTFLYEIEMCDLDAADHGNPRKVSVRVIRPRTLHGETLDFDPKNIRKNFDLGYVAALESGW